MSHFTVLVIGNNIEKLLQPFHEYECTGIEDEYVIDVDKTEEVEQFLNTTVFFANTPVGKPDYNEYEESAISEWGAGNYSSTTRLEWLKANNLDVKEEVNKWFGYSFVDGKWLRRTNPNKKWDWWVVGGRWSNLLTLKNGLKADSALKKDIDFDAMREESRLNASTRWHAVNDIVTKSDSFKPWKDVVELYTPTNTARDFYQSQEEVKAFKALDMGWSHQVEDFLVPEEQFIKEHVDSTLVTFAVLKDGQWYQRGKMGWWATVSDAMEDKEWNKQVSELYDSIPDDELITIVDCHI